LNETTLFKSSDYIIHLITYIQYNVYIYISISKYTNHVFDTV